MQPEVLHINIPAITETGKPAHRLACYQWGSSQAPETILCVHGLSRNARDFDFVAHTLSASGRYRILCPDMPGRGQSSWLADPNQYNYATYVGDCLAMLHHLGVSRLHWLGTSMGGIIGMMLANAAPGMIASLILNDVGCLIPAAGLKRIMGYVGTKPVFDSRAEAEAAYRNTAASFGVTDESHWQHIFTYGLHTDPDGKTRFAYDPAIVAALPKGDDIKDVDLWPLWEAIKPMPTLLIRGERSDILTAETAVKMQQSHPKLTLHTIANTGHAPMLMKDTEIAMIADWLSRR